jgi:hypothetical protein
MKHRLFAMMMAILGWTVCAQAELLHYDAAADYSTAANPNGAWSYGYTAPGTYVDFVAYNHTADLFGNGSLIGWCAGDSGWADPNLNKNMTDNTISGYDITWDAGALAGGGDMEWAYATVLRWTCQTDGVYDINASFTGIQDTWRTDYWLVSRDANYGYDWLMNNNGAGGYGNTETYSNQMTLTAGETLDFLVYGPAHTAISAKINQIPEPSTLVLLGGGLLGIVAFAREKR